MILYYLSEGTLRFNELSKKMPGVTQTTLTSQLRALEKTGLIERRVYPEVPPKVEYLLTDLGKEFSTVLDAVDLFGKTYIHYLNASGATLPLEDRDAESAAQ